MQKERARERIIMFLCFFPVVDTGVGYIAINCNEGIFKSKICYGKRIF